MKYGVCACKGAFTLCIVPSSTSLRIPKDKDGEVTDASFEIALQLVPD